MRVAYYFKFNTRKGFKMIYYLMRLSNASFARVLVDMIRIRHDDMNNVISELDSMEKENKDILSELIKTGYVYP